MRLRITFEVKLDHKTPSEPTPEPPYVANGPEALIERAEPTPIGFQIDMPNHE